MSILSWPGDGTAFAGSDGSITYAADDVFTGSVSLTYQICDDGAPMECDAAVLTITGLALAARRVNVARLL